MKEKNISIILTWLIAFSIAMAFLESAVVVYLRELLYPNGFTFPLVEMDSRLLLTELLREAATIVMLVTIGKFLGNNFTVSFAWFIIAFGIWDIFYYVFLYFLISWPTSLLEWDILFLIPIPWYGPVIAPIIISLLMISLGGIIVYYREKGESIKIKRLEALTMISGCIIVLYAFTEEFIHFSAPFPKSHNTIEKVIHKSRSFVPEKFHWIIFLLGSSMLLIGILLYFKRIKKKNAVFF